MLATKLLFIEFYTDWCGTCQTMAPLLDRLKQKYAEQLEFLKINTDENTALALHYHIRSVPTFLLVRNQEVVWKQAGLLTEKSLSKEIEKFI